MAYDFKAPARYDLILGRNVFTYLQENDFTVKPDECEWAVQETNFLSFWLTLTGPKAVAKVG